MATFVVLRHPDTILVTDFTYPENWTNDIFKGLYLKIGTSLFVIPLHMWQKIDGAVAVVYPTMVHNRFKYDQD